jgi:hypothetical protein
MKPTKEPTLKVFATGKTDRRKSDIVLHETLEEFDPTEVPPDEHPGGCVGFEARRRARILQGQSAWDDDFVVLGPKLYVTKDFEKRARELGLAGRQVLVSGTSKQPFTTEDLGRFLCKIAHGYATAVYGLGSFVPFLTDAIRDIRPMYLSHYVGKIAPWFPYVDGDNYLHVLEDKVVKVGLRQLIVVRIRLLAVDHYPAYEVVVGEVPS